MNVVIRTIAIYMFLLMIFRISGKRSLSQMTSFDFVLILIIGESTQQALLGNDFSITNAILVISTLMIFDIGLSLFKGYVPETEKWIDGLPLVILKDGNPIQERMKKARVEEDDILAAARETQGLERLDQIKYAVLERSGGISIIPKSG